MTDQELTEMPTISEMPTIDEAAARAAVVAAAVTVIDGALAQMMQRELVSSGEVADLLLDVRMLLTGAH